MIGAAAKSKGSSKTLQRINAIASTTTSTLTTESCKLTFDIKLRRKDAYKFFSALNPSGIYCSIGTNLFNYIVINCSNLIDGKLLKVTDVGLEFITTKASGSHIKAKTNPDRQLIRY